MGTKTDPQQGRIDNIAVPTTPDAAATSQDESWKNNFPQAAAANATREAYQQTADERRVQAERAALLEAKRKSIVNADPVPSGEGENPHAEEPGVDAEGESVANPDVDSPPNRQP